MSYESVKSEKNSHLTPKNLYVQWFFFKYSVKPVVFFIKISLYRPLDHLKVVFYHRFYLFYIQMVVGADTQGITHANLLMTLLTSL